MALIKYVLRRLVQAVPTLVGVALIIFFMLRVLPGDPAVIIAGPEASKEQVEEIRRQLGLDKPLHEQLFLFFGDLFRGDLGKSARTGRPVTVEVMEKLPNTILLTVMAHLIAVPTGIVAGVVAAIKRNSSIGLGITFASLFGISMPVYWLGLMLILVFSVTLKLLPAGGIGSPSHLILPSIVLALFLMANIVRITKASMLEVLGQNFIRTARAKGLREKVVLYRHALKNSLIPVITISGIQFGSLLGGAVLTETVFAYPGMGRLIVDGILARDYPLVQGAILIFATLFVAVNVIIDILYAYVDPRVRESLWIERP
ncbi:MAG: ABC transporter permease [Candidatus Caldarchaeum sp.]